MCVYQVLKDVSFSGNFAYILNGWSTTKNTIEDCHTDLLGVIDMT